MKTETAKTNQSAGVSRWKAWSDLLLKTIRYNLKIIFANKFIFFLLAALGFFCLFVILNLNSNRALEDGIAFRWLLFPGLLLIFYPTVFGIQNDEDNRIIEILFAIPNYRYTVWLLRMLLINGVVAFSLILLATLIHFVLLEIPLFTLVFHLSVPIFFIGSLSFMFSTMTRNGNATAVIMIMLGAFLWFTSGVLQHSVWFIFLNPFNLPAGANEAVWAELVFDNRLYLVIGSTIATLVGLLNLQKREKFI